MLRILSRFWDEFLGALLDAVAPSHCPGCGVPDPSLCRACLVLLQRRLDPVCNRCGGTLPGPGRPCPSSHAGLRAITWARAPYRYAGTAGAMVRRLKFESDWGAGFHLASAMRDAVRPSLVGPWRKPVVVPVPLHRTRERQRGFNQAAWLGAEVAAGHGLTLFAGQLERSRATLPQGDPRVLGRGANVEGAFALRGRSRVRGRRVLLVDDVTTSGATARACSRVLLEHGAVEVALLTACASAPSDVST